MIIAISYSFVKVRMKRMLSFVTHFIASHEKFKKTANYLALVIKILKSKQPFHSSIVYIIRDSVILS